MATIKMSEPNYINHIKPGFSCRLPNFNIFIVLVLFLGLSHCMADLIASLKALLACVSSIASS
jgi:hypothetical protein